MSKDKRENETKRKEAKPQEPRPEGATRARDEDGYQQTQSMRKALQSQKAENESGG